MHCEQSVEICHVKAGGMYSDHMLQRFKRIYITVVNVSVYAVSFRYWRFKFSELLCCADGKEYWQCGRSSAFIFMLKQSKSVSAYYNGR